MFRKFRQHLGKFSSREKREVGMAFGKANFDKSEYMPGNKYPNARPSGMGSQEMSMEDFGQSVSHALQDYYLRVVTESAETNVRLEANRQKHRPHLPARAPLSAFLPLDQQMNDFEAVIDNIVMKISRLPENARGMLSYTANFERAWNAFWDVVQKHEGFAYNHPLFASSQWRGTLDRRTGQRNGMRVPGIYWNGRLSKMSSALDKRNGRRMTGALERKENGENTSIEYEVDLAYREKVRTATKEALGIDDVELSKLHWDHKEHGDERKGWAEIIEFHREGRLVDKDTREYMEGEEPQDGIAMIMENYENPEEAEVIIIEYNEVDAMLDLIKADPSWQPLVTRPGLLNEHGVQRMADIMDVHIDHRDWTLYSQDVIVFLQMSGEITDNIDTFEHMDISAKDLALLADLDSANDDTKNKLKALLSTVAATPVGQDTWRRMLQSYSGLFLHQNEDRWQQLLADLGVAGPAAVI